MAHIEDNTSRLGRQQASPALARRGFLKGLAFFSTGGAAVAATAVSAAAPRQDDELLALGSTLEVELARYQDLKKVEQEAVARFEAIEPAIPEGLKLMSGGDLFRTDWPPDHRGASNAMRVQNRIRIPQRYSLDQEVKRLDGRTSAGRYVRRLKKLSDTFHEAHKAAREEAGIGPVETARYRQGRVIVDLNAKIAEIPATTIAGLAVKGLSELSWLVVGQDEGGTRQPPRIVALFENLVAMGAQS